MTFVSVVIPAYNPGATLRQAVDSIGDVDADTVEVIVVDDGSTDGAAQAIAARPGVRVLRQENAGPGAARNAGIESARGDWVAFLDADDIWLPGRIDALLAEPPPAEAVLAYSDYFIRTEGQVEPRRVRCMTLPNPPTGILLTENPISTSTVVARRDALASTSGFDTGLRFAEDWDLWLRLRSLGAFHHVAEPWIERREHADSLSRADPAYTHACRTRVMTRALARSPELFRHVQRRAQANLDLRTGLAFYGRRRHDRAARHLAAAVGRGRLRPTWKYLVWALLRSEPRWWQE